MVLFVCFLVCGDCASHRLCAGILCIAPMSILYIDRYPRNLLSSFFPPFRRVCDRTQLVQHDTRNGKDQTLTVRESGVRY